MQSPKPRKKSLKKAVMGSMKPTKVSKVQKSVAASGQEKRKAAYAGKGAAVSNANAITNEYAKRKKAVAGGAKDSMSYSQLRDLKNTRSEMASGIASKYDFNYNTTRPAQNLVGASKKLVKVSKKMNQAGGRKPSR